MSSKIYDAFDKIHADESLKRKTRERISQEIARKSSRRLSPVRLCISGLLIFLIAGSAIGGYLMYTTPVAAVSIEADQYVLLNLNRFDKIIDAVSYDDKGNAVSQLSDLKHASCQEAVEALLEDASYEEALTRNVPVQIYVTGDDSETVVQLQEEIENYASRNQENITCHHGDSQDMDAAQQLGLSYGKYESYLLLKELYPSITPEEVQSLSMKEIRSLLEGSSNPQDSGTSSSPSQGSQGNRFGASDSQGTSYGSSSHSQEHSSQTSGNHQGNAEQKQSQKLQKGKH